MKEKLRGIVIGLVIGVSITITGVFAANGSVMRELWYNNIKITLDNKTVAPIDADGNYVEPFIIDGTTYLPVRAISNALGMYVDWDANTNTVQLYTQKPQEESVNQEQNKNITSSKVDEESFKKIEIAFYEIDGKLYAQNGFYSHGDTLDVYCLEDGTESLLFVDEYLGNIRLRTLLRKCVGPVQTIESDNPYITIPEIARTTVESDEALGISFGEDEVEYLSATEEFIPTWIKYNGVKVYNSKKIKEYREENGIRKFNGMICVQDAFKKWNINKSFKVKQVEGKNCLVISNK